MSRYLVISEVSTALRDILWSAINTDARLRAAVPTREAISLGNPSEAIKSGDARLSLWLYNLWENEFLRNLPERGVRPPPLALSLRYLITPLTGNSKTDQMVLGKAMAALHEDPAMKIALPPEDIYEDVKINLMRLTLEDLSRVWEALSEPYRLSVCYEVRSVNIHAGTELGGDTVRERATGKPAPDRPVVGAL